MVLSGNSRATYSMGANAVCTVMAKTYEAGSAAGNVQGSAPASKVKVVGKKEEKHSDFDLSSAPIVIGVGRGFKQQADIKLAEDLAKSFPGGAVGCSLPIAADLKGLGEGPWMAFCQRQSTIWASTRWAVRRSANSRNAVRLPSWRKLSAARLALSGR